MSELQLRQLHHSPTLKRAISTLEHQIYTPPANDFQMPTVYSVSADGLGIQGLNPGKDTHILSESPIERIIHLMRDCLYQGEYSLDQLLQSDRAIPFTSVQANTRISICLTYVPIREQNGLQYSFLLNNSHSCRRPCWIDLATLRDYAPEGSTPEEVKSAREMLKERKLWHHKQYYALSRPMSERETIYTLTYFALCCSRYIQRYLDVVYLQAKEYGYAPDYFRPRSDADICHLLESAI